MLSHSVQANYTINQDLYQLPAMPECIVPDATADIPCHILLYMAMNTILVPGEVRIGETAEHSCG